MAASLSPAVEVAVLEMSGPVSLAHEPESTKVNSGTEKRPILRNALLAKCTKAPARSMSYALAREKGAQPCQECWSQPA